MKLGILGTGKIVQEFLPWLVEHTPFTVQAVCSTSRSAALAQELCEKYGVAAAIHMAESPIAFMAAVHSAAAMKNVLAVEFHSVDHPEWFGLVNPKIRLKNGFMQVPDAPGLGIESLNEELVEKFRKADCEKPWSDTSAWDKEWSNDREWS